MADVEEKVEKCKKYLEADLEDSKLLYVLKKLAHLEITIDILQDTGIGKLVNSFKKRDGQVGEKARNIVNNWKKIVAAEAERLKEEEEAAMENNESEQESSSDEDESETEQAPTQEIAMEDKANSDHKKDASGEIQKITSDQNDNKAETSKTESHRHSRHETDKHQSSTDRSQKLKDHSKDSEKEKTDKDKHEKHHSKDSKHERQHSKDSSEKENQNSSKASHRTHHSGTESHVSKNSKEHKNEKHRLHKTDRDSSRPTDHHKSRHSKSENTSHSKHKGDDSSSNRHKSHSDRSSCVNKVGRESELTSTSGRCQSSDNENKHAEKREGKLSQTKSTSEKGDEKIRNESKKDDKKLSEAKALHVENSSIKCPKEAEEERKISQPDMSKECKEINKAYMEEQVSPILSQEISTKQGKVSEHYKTEKIRTSESGMENRSKTLNANVEIEHNQKSYADFDEKRNNKENDLNQTHIPVTKDNKVSKCEEEMEREELLKQLEDLKRKLEIEKSKNASKVSDSPMKGDVVAEKGGHTSSTVSKSSDENEEKVLGKTTEKEHRNKNQGTPQKLTSSESDDSSFKLHTKSKDDSNKKSKHKKKAKKSKKKSHDKHKSHHKKDKKRSRPASSSRSRSRSPRRKRHKSQKERSVSGSPKRKRHKSNRERSTSPRRNHSRTYSNRAVSRSPRRKNSVLHHRKNSDSFSDKSDRFFSRHRRSTSHDGSHHRKNSESFRDRSDRVLSSRHRRSNSHDSHKEPSSKSSEHRKAFVSRQNSRSERKDSLKQEQPSSDKIKDHYSSKETYKEHKHKHKRTWSTDSESSSSASSPLKQNFLNEDTNDSWAAKASAPTAMVKDGENVSGASINEKNVGKENKNSLPDDKYALKLKDHGRGSDKDSNQSSLHSVVKHIENSSGLDLNDRDSSNCDRNSSSELKSCSNETLLKEKGHNKLNEKSDRKIRQDQESPRAEDTGRSDKSKNANAGEEKSSQYTETDRRKGKSIHSDRGHENKKDSVDCKREEQKVAESKETHGVRHKDKVSKSDRDRQDKILHGHRNEKHRMTEKHDKNDKKGSSHISSTETMSNKRNTDHNDNNGNATHVDVLSKIDNDKKGKNENDIISDSEIHKTDAHTVSLSSKGLSEKVRSDMHNNVNIKKDYQTSSERHKKESSSDRNEKKFKSHSSDIHVSSVVERGNDSSDRLRSDRDTDSDKLYERHRHNEKQKHEKHKKTSKSERDHKIEKHSCDKQSSSDKHKKTETHGEKAKSGTDKEKYASRGDKDSANNKHDITKQRTSDKDNAKSSAADAHWSHKSEMKHRTGKDHKTESKSSKHSSGRDKHKSRKQEKDRHQKEIKKSDSQKHSVHNKEKKSNREQKLERRENFEDMLCFDNSDATVSTTSGHAKKEADRYEILKAKYKIKKKSESNTLGMGGKIQKPVYKRKADDQEETSSPKKAFQDGDLSSYLPSTQAHYRPFRFTDVDSKKSAQDDETPFLGLKTNTRTQVYSGKKQTGLTEMFSLFDLCMKVLQDNIDLIDYVGGIPLDILKPVLEKCTPKQLYDLEDYNPHFLEDSDYMWKIHCEREFRGCQSEEMETWRELYLRKFDEREEKFKSIKANISKQMASAAPARQVKLAYIDNVAKPPREVRRQQMKFGTTNTIQTKAGAGNSVKNRFQAVDMIAIGRDKQQQAEKQALQASKTPMMQKTIKMMKNLYKR